MAYRYRYDYGDAGDERYRRDYEDDEGLVDRVLDWARGRVRDRDRDYDRGNRDYGRGSRDYGDYRNQQRGYRSGSNRDYSRDYGSNRDASEWERTRQWRHDYGGDEENEGGYIDRYGQNQPRYGSGWGTDRDYEYGLGRNPYEEQPDRYGYGRGYERDDDRDYRFRSGRDRGYGWDQMDNEAGDYHRDFYSNRGRGYGQRGSRQAGYSRDYGRDWGEYSNRGFRGVYPSAGMGADFEGRAGSRYHDYAEDDEDVNYGTGDVGYESEGAFYQDMDEPTNYRAQSYRYGTGQRRSYGMGPLDYQRSDERITEDVNERLTRHGRVDATNIEVEVKNGEVFLKGSVPDREMKRLAEDVAEDIRGVKDVHNAMKVNRGSRDRSRDWETQQHESGQAWGSSQQGGQDWQTSAETGPAGQSNVGEGFETEGATSMEGLESIQQQTPNPQSTPETYGSAAGTTAQTTYGRHNLREGMEVIGSSGSSIGKVKEVRVSDFLIDREMARDIYVPFSAITSVGEQILLNVSAGDVDNQGWEKPAII
ncbi:MAG: BON domain-containing protein [Chloroflexi bacterium]|nr:MAG: BON domain-containing protein [Chloroflexota bacterium]